MNYTMLEAHTMLVNPNERLDDLPPVELVDEADDDAPVTLPIRPVDFPKWYASKQIGVGE